MRRGLILMRPIDLGRRSSVPEAFLRDLSAAGAGPVDIGEERSVDSHHSLRLRLGVAGLELEGPGPAGGVPAWSERSFLGFAEPVARGPEGDPPIPGLGATFSSLVDRIEIQAYPIGVAVAVAYLSWSETGKKADHLPVDHAGDRTPLCELLEGIDEGNELTEVPAVVEEAFGHWEQVREELEDAMKSGALLGAVLDALAGGREVELIDVERTAAEQASPWLHRLWWEEGNGRDTCFVAGSGSSVLCADQARPERSRSCVDVLALANALWFFEDLADAECVRKIAQVDSSEHLPPKKIKREERWIWETAIVPTVARSVLTSLPTFALRCWQQLDRVWEFKTVERNLDAKIEVLRAMLIDREARNRRTRERWAVAALAFLGGASLASAATDLVGQLTKEPVNIGSVNGSRLVVLGVILTLSAAVVLVLGRRGRDD